MKETKLSKLDYWDKKAPWWLVQKLWEKDEIIPNKLVKELECNGKHEDVRIRQICFRLVELIIPKNEKVLREEGDGFVEWLLEKKMKRKIEDKIVEIE